MHLLRDLLSSAYLDGRDLVTCTHTVARIHTVWSVNYRLLQCPGFFFFFDLFDDSHVVCVPCAVCSVSDGELDLDGQSTMSVCS